MSYRAFSSRTDSHPYDVALLECPDIDLYAIGPYPWAKACDESRFLLWGAVGEEKSPSPLVIPRSD